ncbi:hypothetical protein [Hyphomicrobium sp.]|uniref:hypothetical protein n=1 Tax=Hyphomicrobium sp. TaxID=82 RepID=UPI002CCBF88E|nr:hypothetical protein [Hyphomicrobium sp.]HVZ03091.1 hypothetical protein [Hyphomicrobium sp.]
MSIVIATALFSNAAQSQSSNDDREKAPTTASDQQSFSKAEKANAKQRTSTEGTDQPETPPPSQGTLADEAPNIVPVRPGAEPSSSAPQGTLADEAPTIIPLASPNIAK